MKRDIKPTTSQRPRKTKRPVSKRTLIPDLSGTAVQIEFRQIHVRRVAGLLQLWFNEAEDQEGRAEIHSELRRFMDELGHSGFQATMSYLRQISGPEPQLKMEVFPGAFCADPAVGSAACKEGSTTICPQCPNLIWPRARDQEKMSS
jgi:hypothetical protein